MPEKSGLNSPRSSSKAFAWLFRPSPLHQWRFHFLTAMVFVSMVVVWSIDGCTIKSFVESLRSTKPQLITAAKFRPQPTANLAQENPHRENFTTADADFTLPDAPTSPILPLGRDVLNGSSNGSAASSQEDGLLVQMPARVEEESSGGDAEWVTAELEANFTSGLLSRWLAPGGEACKDSHTEEIAIPDLDGKKGILELTAGDSHELIFQAVDESKNPRCSGGDYFESDLSGQSWKSRPLVKDFGNGNYSITLQVHPDFAGDYDLTLILLYRHFEGLKFSPGRFAIDKELRKLRVRFTATGNIQLPQLKACSKSDFSRDLWVGRWTRHGKNDDCKISYDGRYRCLPSDFPCRNPWCRGSLGELESNGWVYSTHCSFNLYQPDSGWNCLKNRWIFFWGDSNHVDTIRNLLNFVLNLPDVKSVPRRFDRNFTNPNDASQSVRITSIFNGHWNETQNYQGLNSLRNDGFRDLLKKYFTEDTVPDTVIMNSGLHDGIYWPNLRQFAGGADYAARFWGEVMDSVRRRGLAAPRVIYRTTVTTAGDARKMAFNPSKMEAFNWVVLDKFRRAGVMDGVVDDFDMTFPWHFDHRCSDGVHYGRAPLRMKWKDGEIGHQYFVDIMLAHVLLNVLCAR
ncbi:unnamed protein product [Linum tenue]|uniref:Uncharacterized protein n=2 Tax=Linum tenue TaxID=586396 RepID=A0AAV0RU04_9ROSI|nr:unnamed protein product [Linum tenue]